MTEMTKNKNKGEATLWVHLLDGFLLETEKEKCEVEGMLMVCLDGLFGWRLVTKKFKI